MTTYRFVSEKPNRSTSRRDNSNPTVPEAIAKVMDNIYCETIGLNQLECDERREIIASTGRDDLQLVAK